MLKNVGRSLLDFRKDGSSFVLGNRRPGDHFVLAYTEVYDVPRYTSLEEYMNSDKSRDRRDYNGIPYLIKVFEDFDPINDHMNTIVYRKYEVRDHLVADYVDIHHANSFLNLITLDKIKDILQSADKCKDALIHGILSFLNNWPDRSLDDFNRIFPQHSDIVDTFKQYRDESVIYKIKNNNQCILFLRSHIRLLTKVYHMRTTDNDLIAPVAPLTFDVCTHISSELLAHFQSVHKAICDETMTDDLCNLIENDQIMLTDFCSNPDGSKLKYSEDCMKIITGQACCGKTTLAQELSKSGWKLMSRGDIGTFSGKSKSPASVAGLHASIEYAFRRGDIIGDRGPIDNPLWIIIMQLCDSSIPMDDVVNTILNFISQNFNENALRYFAQQQCIVFIDPLPSRNRARMLRRFTSGDAHRARIQNYFIQAIAYYIVARLCGWKVFTVPYDYNDFSYKPEKYMDIVKDIASRFGLPRAVNETLYPISSMKPAAATDEGTTQLGKRKYDECMEYAQSVGIYK